MDGTKDRSLPTGTGTAGSVTGAQLFDVLWANLSDVLGSAATATVLRRSIKSLASRRSGLGDLAITRQGLEYRYVLPPEWKVPSAAAVTDIRELVGELQPLLATLTGQVILRQLDKISEFEACGISFSEGNGHE